MVVSWLIYPARLCTLSCEKAPMNTWDYTERCMGLNGYYMKDQTYKTINSRILPKCINLLVPLQYNVSYLCIWRGFKFTDQPYPPPSALYPVGVDQKSLEEKGDLHPLTPLECLPLHHGSPWTCARSLAVFSSLVGTSPRKEGGWGGSKIRD